MTATVRTCLAAGVAAVATVALLGIPGDSGERTHTIAAGPLGASDEAAALRTARETGKAVRIDRLTSETTEVYALPGGKLRADIAAGMQRFRRDGTWVSVDQKLRQAADGSVAAVAHPG